MTALGPLPVTLALFAANVAVYLVMVWTAEPRHLEFTVEQLVAAGGIYSPALREGEWWRLVTATFVHASPDHLLWNMASLFMLGRYLEPRYAWARFSLLYLLCGVVSSAASAAWYWSTDIVQIGASGAITGLVGAGAVSAWRMGERGRSFRNSMLVWAVVVLVNGALYSANNVAHATGLLTGMFSVAIFGRRGRAALLPRMAGGPSLDDATGVSCPRCSTPNPTGSRYCGKCGSALDAAVTPG